MFQGSGVVERYDGLFSEYLAQHADEKATATPKITLDKPKPVAPVKKKLTYHEKKEWETIEDEITVLETRLQAIPDEMAQFGTDYIKLGELQKEQDQLEATLEEKMLRWEYLSDIVAG